MVSVKHINLYRTACKLERHCEADQEVDDNTRLVRFMSEVFVKSLLTFVCSSTRDLAQPGDILQQPGQGVEGRLLQKLLADLNMIALLYLQTLGQRNFHPQLQ